MNDIISGLTSHQSEGRTMRSSFNELGQPVFIVNDVCEILDIANSRDAISKLDEDEVAAVVITDTSSNGVTQKRTLNAVTESGLYALIFQSRKPEAHAFRKWVTSEVLPALRQTGAYALPVVPDRIQRMRLRLQAAELRAKAAGLEAQARIGGKPSTNAYDRALPPTELAGGVAICDWLRAQGAHETHMASQRLARRLRQRGLPVGKVRNEINSWVLIARPHDLEDVADPAELPGLKGGA